MMDIINTFWITNFKKFTAVKPKKVDVRFSEVINAAVNGHALVLTKTLISISSEAKCHSVYY